VILAFIIATEIGFWVLIVLGLIARYPLRLKRTGAVFLAMTPIVDLILLTATALDLMAGATASAFHGFAALYVGFSVAYGHKVIHWADIRFAHKFAEGPAPVKWFGSQQTRERWKDVARTTLAVMIAATILWLITALVNDTTRTGALTILYSILAAILAVDVLWAVRYTIWPKVPAQPS